MRPAISKMGWRLFASVSDGVILIRKASTSGIRQTEGGPDPNLETSMKQQEAYAGDGHSQTGRDGWTGLVNSFIGFTNAATMFTIQQMQNSLALFTDSRRTVDRFKRAIDSLSQAMNSEVDESKKST